MKALFTLILLISLNSHAQTDYECISDTLQAMNSDIFTALTPEEIDDMIENEESLGHSYALIALEICGIGEK